MRARAAEDHLASLAREMVQGLGKAVTMSDRLRWLDATKDQQAGVKRFFETHTEKLDATRLESSAGQVTVLPSGREMKLFRLTTKALPEGAMVQVRDDGGRARMHWGLFEQSHEKTYDRFLASADRREPAQWFSLLCERAHSFELKGATKDQWICLVAQGSLAKTGTGQVYVNKESAVGRFLEAKSRWGSLYLVELLVGKMEVDGQLLNVVLDCAGLHGGGRRP